MKRFSVLDFRFTILALALASSCGDGGDDNGGKDTGKGKIRQTDGVIATVQAKNFDAFGTGKKDETFTIDTFGSGKEDLHCTILEGSQGSGYGVGLPVPDGAELVTSGYSGSGQYEGSMDGRSMKEVKCAITIDPGEKSGRFTCNCDPATDSQCVSKSTSLLTGEFECVGEFKTKTM